MSCYRQFSKYNTYFCHFLAIIELSIHNFSCSEWPLVKKEKGQVICLQKKNTTMPASRSNFV